MGVLMHSFFSLPIYKRDHEKYNEDHEEDLGKRKIHFSNLCGTPFDELNKDLKYSMEQRWYWPPWKFNDIVGYLNIGMDGGNCLTADIFLRRKYFPRKHYWRNDGFSTLENQHILYALEIEKIEINVDNNQSYINALNIVIERTKSFFKKRRKKYYIWTPIYSFECFEFVRAYKELKKYKCVI
jgi:hypothetical protein